MYKYMCVRCCLVYFGLIPFMLWIDRSCTLEPGFLAGSARATSHRLLQIEDHYPIQPQTDLVWSDSLDHPITKWGIQDKVSCFMGYCGLWMFMGRYIYQYVDVSSCNRAARLVVVAVV